MFQLHAVVDIGVPRGIAASARLEFSASKESEKKVDLVFPEVLIELLRGVVGARRLWRGRVKPAGNDTEGREQGDTRSALSCTLRGVQSCYGLVVGTRRIRQVVDGDGGHHVPRQEHLERKCSIKGLVPGSDPAGKHSTHWQSAIKTTGVQLHQPGRDD